MQALPKFQKRTPTPYTSLKYLSVACHELALEAGGNEVLHRARTLSQARTFS